MIFQKGAEPREMIFDLLPASQLDLAHQVSSEVDLLSKVFVADERLERRVEVTLSVELKEIKDQCLQTLNVSLHKKAIVESF